MRPEEFRSKWTAEAAAMERRGGLVRGGTIIAEMLADVEALLETPQEELLSLEEAAKTSGYSTDHLARLARDGRLPLRRPPGTRRLLFRRGDLPIKPGRRDTPDADVHDLASRLFRGREGHHGHS